MAVGAVILRDLYANDYHTFRLKSRTDRACTALAQRLTSPGRPVSAAGLRLAVHTSELARQHGGGAVAILGPSHLRALAGLPTEAQAELIHRVRTGAVSERALARAASRVRQKLANGRGRPVLPDYLKALRAVDRALTALRGQLDGLEGAELRSASEATELRRIATRLAEVGGELRRRLTPAPERTDPTRRPR